MNQATNLLLMHLPGVSATAKYFLVKTLYLGHEATGRMSLDELCSQFRLTRQVMIRVRKELTEPVKKYGGGYLLEKCSVGAGHRGRGRPRKYFQLNPAFLTDISLGGQEEGVVNAVPCGFLMQAPAELWTASPKGKEGEAKAEAVKNRLSALNLYFLVVLWGLADEMGAIWQKGVGEIAQLAGMTRTQANNHLGKLKQMGYVNARLPGVSGSLLFGRSAGAIFLDPVHPNMAPIWGDVEWFWKRHRNSERMFSGVDSAFLTASKIDLYEKELREKGGDYKGIMADLYFNKRYFEGGPPFQDAWRELAQPGEFLGVHRVLLNGFWPVGNYIKAVLCQYARRILEEHIDIIFKHEEILDIKMLEELERLVAINVDSDRKRAKGVALWFYSRAHFLAREIFLQRAMVLVHEEKDKSNLDYFQRFKQARTALAQSGEIWSFFPERGGNITRILIKRKKGFKG